MKGGGGNWPELKPAIIVREPLMSAGESRSGSSRLPGGTYYDPDSTAFAAVPLPAVTPSPGPLGRIRPPIEVIGEPA